LIPLAASLLYLAWKFEWYAMVAAGAAATYLTCLSKGDSRAALAVTQILLLAYWLLFEAFDLLRMRRRAISGGVEWIFPANAAGFLGVSFLAWSAHAPGDLWRAWLMLRCCIWRVQSCTLSYGRPLRSRMLNLSRCGFAQAVLREQY
jgi:hypothetical protein